MLHEGNVTADTFCNFIISLTKSVNKNVFLVVDGYRIYHPKKVNALIEKLNGKMTLLFLQPYSLQLNPSFYGVISSSTSVKNTFKTKEN
uniref:DDE superfamily endonuclease n=1 Tax=Candidatus Kentrum eta TaxID=2126337 RepID=A0A450V9S3_9GAMM|nr:MAG: DDE superfamily endonuclease [Candidatus Kentron sp. H]VFK01645.1 MAG: DDE superfamily endonuclease [Candidatus Kentron sp. H]VFK05098.1 MAG: DDE superfamily endonuclease [Candidatus Kentron sp. H]